MLAFEDITGCKAIIHDAKTDRILSEATIRAYHKATHVAVIDAKHLPGEESLQVSLSILTSTGMVECLGIAHRPTSTSRDISLFKMLTKNSRSMERYDLCSRAAISQLIMDGQRISMPCPLEVTVENISSGGVMISTTEPILDVGSAFLLQLDIAGTLTYLHTSIVRLAQEGETRKFGCIFHAICDAQGQPLPGNGSATPSGRGPTA